MNSPGRQRFFCGSAIPGSEPCTQTVTPSSCVRGPKKEWKEAKQCWKSIEEEGLPKVTQIKRLTPGLIHKILNKWFLSTHDSYPIDIYFLWLEKRGRERISRMPECEAAAAVDRGRFLPPLPSSFFLPFPSYPSIALAHWPLSLLSSGSWRWRMDAFFCLNVCIVVFTARSWTVK